MSFLLVLFVVFAGQTRVRAQGDEAPPDQGGVQAKVGTITIKFVGTANVSEDVIRSNMQLRDGGDLDEATLDKDIRDLYRTGLFEYIQTRWEQVNEHTYNLIVEVTPKFRVLAIRYVGNHQLKTHRLEKEVKTKPNTALDERQVKEDSEKIRELYQKQGYNQISITYRIDRDRTTGFGTVIFNIHEGNRVKIAAVKFVGNAHVKTKALRKQMDTKKWWMFSWLTGDGRFKDDTFDDDLDKLRDFYREDGYLDVDISEDKVLFEYPKPDRLVLVIPINEGRQYRIGQITFSGNKIHSSALLRRVVRQKPGMIFTPSRLDKDIERLSDFYGKDGYLYTDVRLDRRPNLTTNNIDIEYRIGEGDKYNVESIEIDGNTKTKSTVVLRELVLGPGDVFNTVRMKISQARLENTRFFDDVDIKNQPTNIPGRENMRVTVKEGRTGSLTFGAGYSSLERATVFAEISQSNFDLFNGRSLFQGDGQKFRIRLELGEVSSEAIISFTEPYINQQPLQLDTNVFRTSSDYNSTYYDEVDLGANISISKMLFELVRAQIGYEYDVIEIQNVASSASPIIAAAAGDNTESKVFVTLSRQTLDKLINPTSGNSISLKTTVAGGPFGGSANYYEFNFKGSQFFPIFEAQNQVLELFMMGGVIKNFGSSTTVPYYDALYLGGPDDLRGYQYRFVSPRDIYGEPIGGKSQAEFTAEYSLDIVSPIRFAVFYDAGFVNPGSFDFSFNNYQDDFGVGLRLFVMGAPLSLDYGIPVRGDSHYKDKQGNQFNFSFGTRF
ncbi:MAG TPA: outer membrane protein assembly factor BamA [Opitutaceae bacterium]